MTRKEKSRLSVGSTQNGRGKRRSITSTPIVRQSGKPVNFVFSCGFIGEVFEQLSQPTTVEEIARKTDSPTERVLLAIHDLKASGVVVR